MSVAYHNRDTWASQPPRNMTPRVVGYNDDGWVLHWPGPYTDYGRDWADELDAYRAYHMNVRGWQFLAYSFAVDPDGGLWEGRGWGYQNAANLGANSSTYSLLFLGTGQRSDGTEVGPTDAAIRSAGRIMADQPGNGWVRAHRAVSPLGTRCPGDLITAAIPQMRDPQDEDEMIADLYAAYQTGGRPPRPDELRAWVRHLQESGDDITETCLYIADTVANEGTHQ